MNLNRQLKLLVLLFVVEKCSAQKGQPFIHDEPCAMFGSDEPSVTPNITVTPSQPKTLSIIFDTTGSMWDDLDSLRAAAVTIVEKFQALPENPISDYVLSLFNDPRTTFLKTTNPDSFLMLLDTIFPNGGGDCPELTMEGIINALRISQPNSYAYVFTDADAFDFERAPEVIQLVVEKQIAVNFLTTSTCSGDDAPGRLVFDQIAEFSGGAVYDMSRDDVGDVLLALSEQLERDFVIIDALELLRDVESITLVNVDSSFESITVTINGRRSSIRVTHEDGTEVDVTKVFESDNVKIIRFPVTAGGIFKVITTAESDYSLRIGGISTVKFNFGFSSLLPSSIDETSVEPVWEKTNTLSFFSSDLGASVKCLTKVTIIPLNSTGSDKLFDEFDLDITHKDGSIYSTDKWVMPRGGFKIRVTGYDKFGNPFERLVSTGIIEKKCSCDSSAPEEPSPSSPLPSSPPMTDSWIGSLPSSPLPSSESGIGNPPPSNATPSTAPSDIEPPSTPEISQISITPTTLPSFSSPSESFSTPTDIFNSSSSLTSPQSSTRPRTRSRHHNNSRSREKYLN